VIFTNINIKGHHLEQDHLTSGQCSMWQSVSCLTGTWSVSCEFKPHLMAPIVSLSFWYICNC